ncbi:MAG TPA: hypothetical protein VMU85_05150 [Stellaceae bacterium]|nr:hypothetical protein [Stellaceae bacterium]
MAEGIAKKDFLVVHDYGMGGLWGILRARSEAEIEARYRGLKVACGRPAWMSAAHYARIARTRSSDIDADPPDWLLEHVKDRQ